MKPHVEIERPGMPDARILYMDDQGTREIDIEKLGYLLAGDYQKEVLKHLNTIGGADDAERYRILTWTIDEWRAGRIPKEHWAKLTVHLLLRPDEMAGLLIGIGKRKGIFREEKPKAAAEPALRLV